MNYPRRLLKEMPSSSCRQIMVLLKVMAPVQLFWKSLLKIFSSTLQLLTNMLSKLYWMKWSLCSPLRTTRSC